MSSVDNCLKIWKFPDHLLEYLIDFLPQDSTINLMRCNKRFHLLSSKKLYSKIYLSDSLIASSEVYNIGRLWSVLKFPKEYLNHLKKEIYNTNNVNNNIGIYEILNQVLCGKLRRLVSTLKNSKYDYINLIREIWIDQDLNDDLQNDFVELLCKNSNSVQLIRGIFNSQIMETVYLDNKKLLKNLELAPEFLYPHIIQKGYLKKLSEIFNDSIEKNHGILQTLALPYNPLILLNSLDTTFEKKLRVESMRYDIRRDQLPNDSDSFKYSKLSDIIDPESLKSITISCWLTQHFDNYLNDFFISNLWEDFDNIEDITFISMVVDESQIVNFLEKTPSKLKRFRFHFASPAEYDLSKESKILKSLIKYHSKSLEFLDINVHDDAYKVYEYDIFNGKVEKKIYDEDNEFIGCYCNDCLVTKNQIFEKIFTRITNDDVDSSFIFTLDEFDERDIIKYIFRKGLIPYTLSFEKYPSFINVLKIYDCISQIHRVHGLSLNYDDFQAIYRSLLHNILVVEKNFMLEKFPKLKSLVINDIPFVVIDDNLQPVFDFPG